MTHFVSIGMQNFTQSTSVDHIVTVTGIVW